MQKDKGDSSNGSDERLDKPKNSMEDVFDQISDVLRFCYDKAHLPANSEITEEMEQNLNNLEKQVEQMEKNVDKMIAETGSDWKVVEDLVKGRGREGIGVRNKDLLERAEQLKKEAQEASQNLLKASNKSKATGSVPGKAKKKSKQTPQKRKSKFKRLGGSQDWKPL